MICNFREKAKIILKNFLNKIQKGILWKHFGVQKYWSFFIMIINLERHKVKVTMLLLLVVKMTNTIAVI